MTSDQIKVALQAIRATPEKSTIFFLSDNPESLLNALEAKTTDRYIQGELLIVDGPLLTSDIERARKMYQHIQGRQAESGWVLHVWFGLEFITPAEAAGRAEAARRWDEA